MMGQKLIMRLFRFLAVSIALVVISSPLAGAQSDPNRDATREKVRQVLDTYGPREMNVTFHQSTKNPYNFAGSMTTGLKNCDSLEIVVSVTTKDTLRFSVYPHYHGGYLNVGKARDTSGLMRKLLSFNDENFLFWGADDSGDIFSAYSFTLESGFPQDAIVVVMRSIRNTDRFAGELRTFVDGSSPA